jgi:flagellar hook assembly protein FlgD
VGNANTPRALAFAAPSPNPARTATTLGYTLPHASRVHLAVYDAAGRLVRNLEHGEQAAGEHVASWDLRDAQGHEQGTGVYFARLTADGHTLVRRIAIER